MARQAGAGRTLVAMTHDPALVAAIQELAAAGLPCHIAQDLRALADLLMEQEAAVALLDAQALGVPADAAVDAVKNQFPEVRLMVAGHAAEQNMLAGRIADQKVFRFVHKPASAQRLRLFVDAAAQSGERQAAQGAPSLQVPGAGSTQPPGGSNSMLPILAGVAGVVAVAIGGWMLMRKEEAPATAPVAQAQPAQTSPELVAALQRAASAFSANRFVAADGSSAAELYREALRISPGHADATRGFDAAIERALGGAEQALLAGQLEQARVTAELLRLIVPDNARLAFLYTQIERELARLNADATQRQAFEARQAQIRGAVAQVEQRIARGALLEPADDSAVARFRDAQAIGGGDPMVRGARDALVAALLTAADRELRADRVVPARQLVEAAGTVNSSAPGLDFVRKRIDEAMIQKAAVSLAAPVVAPPVAPAANPVLPASPPGNAPAAAPAATSNAAPANTAPANVAARAPATATPPAQDSVVSATTLRAVRSVAPDYPQQALQNLVSGWVEMEFTVTPEGHVRDVTVIESEPGRTFDSAAVAAIRRYRYEPVMRDGVAVEQRARLRMRFTAQDDR